MGGKSTPDYESIATVEGENDRQIVEDQHSPWGYTNWTQQDLPNGTKKWIQTTGLNPQLQETLNKQFAIEGAKTDVAGNLVNRMGQEFGSGVDWRGLSPMGGVPSAQFTLPEPDIGDPNAFRSRAEQAMFDQANSRLDPMYDGKRTALETRLRGQGLSAGDESWEAQMNELGRQENDARNQAMWSSVGAGRQEADSMFDQMMDRNQNNYQQAFGANQANFGQMKDTSNMATALRQQQMAEKMQQRGFSLNEINALMSGGQVAMPGMPDFYAGGRSQGPDLTGGAMANANAENAKAQNTQNAIGTAAMTAAMFSDRRLKTNIERIGTVNGYPWYSFTYVWGEEAQGVMADEVPAEFTGEVGGYKTVDYSRILGD